MCNAGLADTLNLKRVLAQCAAGRGDTTAAFLEKRIGTGCAAVEVHHAGQHIGAVEDCSHAVGLATAPRGELKNAGKDRLDRLNRIGLMTSTL